MEGKVKDNTGWQKKRQPFLLKSNTSKTCSAMLFIVNAQEELLSPGNNYC
jgi:hypothetical protein